MAKILPLSFYDRDTAKVAKELLGQHLVRVMPDGRRVVARIVETEAYIGIEDGACHAFGDRRTKRTSSLYLGAGHSYVFLIYGMYECFNVVTRKSGDPQAVLIRALEPVEGIEIMRENRTVKRDLDLTSGPGKLCRALAIDRSLDAHRLDEVPLFIEESKRVFPSKIEASPRIGVDYAGEAAAWPLRFHERDNPYVSKRPRPARLVKTSAKTLSQCR
ncbi:MAG: DNA-3-methyladenine glycosylase [Bdellovibrionota bacterium]